MNITNAEIGMDVTVKAIHTDDDELRSFLFSLGCYSGERLTVIARKKGSYILSIKDARYTIDEDLAQAIEI